MSNLQQLYAIEANIKSNIESIQKLVEEAESLKNSIANLQGDQKKMMEKHLDSITEIITKLAEQTIEMFAAFREFVQ